MTYTLRRDGSASEALLDEMARFDPSEFELLALAIAYLDATLPPRDVVPATAHPVQPTITEAVARLPDLERRILTRRLGLADGMPRTLEEIARDIDVSIDELARVEARAQRGLAKWMPRRSSHAGGRTSVFAIRSAGDEYRPRGIFVVAGLVYDFAAGLVWGTGHDAGQDGS